MAPKAKKTTTKKAPAKKPLKEVLPAKEKEPCEECNGSGLKNPDQLCAACAGSGDK